MKNGEILLVFVVFRGNRRFSKNKVLRRVLGRSWVDLGRQKGSSWEAFWDLSWVKKGKALRCEKRPRLAMPWGGVDSIGVRQLWPGSDKGETGLGGPRRPCRPVLTTYHTLPPTY